MAKAKAKKALAKSSAVEKDLETGLAKLAEASAAVDKSVTVRAGDAKKLNASVKRLSKRKAALTKRKRLSAERAKKAPSGETKKTLAGVVRDLASTEKELTKQRAIKQANGEELAALKAAQKRTKAYTKGIAAAERTLPKQK